MRYGIRESRPVRFQEEMKSYGADLSRTYLDAWKRKDTLAKITGTGMAGLSLALEGPDRLYSAIIGQKLEEAHGVMGRTRRDLWQLAKDIGAFRPLAALGDAWRIATSDVILDGGDAITGHRINKTRSQVQSVLKSDGKYVMAA